MPKCARYLLRCSAEDGRYELRERGEAFVNELTPHARDVPVQASASALPQDPGRPLAVTASLEALAETPLHFRPVSQSHTDVLLEPKFRLPRLWHASACGPDWMPGCSR